MCVCVCVLSCVRALTVELCAEVKALLCVCACALAQSSVNGKFYVYEYCEHVRPSCGEGWFAWRPSPSTSRRIVF